MIVVFCESLLHICESCWGNPDIYTYIHMFIYTYALKSNALITKFVISERGLIWGEQFSGFRCFIRMRMFLFQTSLATQLGFQIQL